MIGKIKGLTARLNSIQNNQSELTPRQQQRISDRLDRVENRLEKRDNRLGERQERLTERLEDIEEEGGSERRVDRIEERIQGIAERRERIQNSRDALLTVRERLSAREPNSPPTNEAPSETPAQQPSPAQPPGEQQPEAPQFAPPTDNDELTILPIDEGTPFTPPQIDPNEEGLSILPIEDPRDVEEESPIEVAPPTTQEPSNSEQESRETSGNEPSRTPSQAPQRENPQAPTQIVELPDDQNSFAPIEGREQIRTLSRIEFELDARKRFARELTSFSSSLRVNRETLSEIETINEDLKVAARRFASAVRRGDEEDIEKFKNEIVDLVEKEFELITGEKREFDPSQLDTSEGLSQFVDERKERLTAVANAIENVNVEARITRRELQQTTFQIKELEDERVTKVEEAVQLASSLGNEITADPQTALDAQLEGLTEQSGLLTT